MTRRVSHTPFSRRATLGLMLGGLSGTYAGGGTVIGGRALIYRGPGGCEGCAEALGAVAARIGMRVTFVGPQELSHARLAEADVYIQGGGDDVDKIADAMGAAGQENLRDYVRGGGRYWGVCAGGYLAGRTRDDAGDLPGLRLFNGDSFPYSPFAARTETVIWMGQPQRMYLQEAPGFALDPGTDAHVLARYQGGEIAALLAPFGRGWVAVSGPHPEATQDWLADDGLTDAHLASPHLADQMLRKLLQA